MKRREWDKVDNSEKSYKINLRKKFLPEGAKVLDLFCGRGEIYKAVYKDKVAKYLGIDILKIHDKRICIKANNLKYIVTNNIDNFDVFDLDDYGSPWKTLYLVLINFHGPEAIFFLTDGLKQRQTIDGNITKWVSATEKIPKGINIPGLGRWYIDIFSTMLLDLQKRFKVKVLDPHYIFNNRQSVCYWYFKIIKV